MKEKTKLRVIQILCIVSLLITVFSIQRTYAKYYEKIDTTYATQIKRWVINVNTKNIHQNETLNEVMQPVLRENEHISGTDVLVPGGEGYFEFLIDYTNVDVAFKYEFDIEQLDETPLTDFQIYGYSIVDGGTETITETTDLTQIINPATNLNSNNEKKRQLRILFRWYDGEDNTMNNQTDTQFEGQEINYNVKITFTQTV